MKSSFRLVTVRGIPIMINYSWFAIFGLITLTLAHYVFPEFYPDWTTLAYWIVGLLTSLLFFASLLLHELAHSMLAIRKGIVVRDITLFIFGGAARISREADNPGTEFLMAIVGPLSSVALAGIFALLWLLGRNTSEPLTAVGMYLCWINLALAAFNMLPGFPLDGGRVMRSIVWWRSRNYRRSTRIATLTGQAVGCMLVLGGAVMGAMVYWFSGLWLTFLGVFLFIAAWVSMRQAILRDGIKGLTARDLMTSDCRTVPAEMSLEDLGNGYLLPGGPRCALIGGRDGLAGVITINDLKDVPQRRWSTTSAAEVMAPVEKMVVVRPEDDGLTVLEKIGEGRAEILLVESGGSILGIIDRYHLQGISRARWDSST
ncbi:MAG: site-2 protease family protein [Dehalococcoidia bacterium]|nr:MAG: site-2 protease family protein [Dehalococcoidia bacterium]